jgi:hypothetical protein
MRGQPRSTDAGVIGLAAIGSDQLNLVKQGGAFGLAAGKQALASSWSTRRRGRGLRRISTAPAP